MTCASAKIPVLLRRRELVRGAGAAMLGFFLPGCGSVAAGSGHTAPRPTAAPESTAARAQRTTKREAARRLREARPGSISVYSCFDLPDTDPRSHELSGIAWDDDARKLFAIQDANARIVTLAPDASLQSWTIEGALDLHIGDNCDLEGLVALPESFYVCSEVGPHIFEVDRAGSVIREIPLPAHYATARRNMSLESLTLSPSGRYLFTTSEAALSCDGLLATVTSGTLVRIARIDLHTNEVVEHVYATDAVPKPDTEAGVSELLALSDDELLVLERSFTRGFGNSARIYRTKLANAAVCTTVEHVDDSWAALPKTLYVDIGLLAMKHPPRVKQTQPSPLLDNYEAMSLGPELPDGRASILLASDDNGRAAQIARIVVLAVG